MKFTTFLYFYFLFNLVVPQPQKAIQLNDGNKAEILLKDYYAIRTKNMDIKISFNSVQILPFIVHSSWDTFQNIFVDKSKNKEVKLVPIAYRESFLKAAIIKTLSTQSTPNKYYPTKGAFHNVLDLNININANTEPFDKDRIIQELQEMIKGQIEYYTLSPLEIDLITVAGQCHEFIGDFYGTSKLQNIVVSFLNAKGYIQYFSGTFIFNNFGSITETSDIDINVSFNVINKCIAAIPPSREPLTFDRTHLISMQYNTCHMPGRVQLDKSDIFFEQHAVQLFMFYFNNFFYDTVSMTSAEYLDVNVYLSTITERRIKQYNNIKKNKNEYSAYLRSSKFLLTNDIYEALSNFKSFITTQKIDIKYFYQGKESSIDDYFKYLETLFHSKLFAIITPMTNELKKCLQLSTGVVNINSVLTITSHLQKQKHDITEEKEEKEKKEKKSKEEKSTRLRAHIKKKKTDNLDAQITNSIKRIDIEKYQKNDLRNICTQLGADYLAPESYYSFEDIVLVKSIQVSSNKKNEKKKDKEEKESQDTKNKENEKEIDGKEEKEEEKEEKDEKEKEIKEKNEEKNKGEEKEDNTKEKVDKEKEILDNIIKEYGSSSYDNSVRQNLLYLIKYSNTFTNYSILEDLDPEKLNKKIKKYLSRMLYSAQFSPLQSCWNKFYRTFFNINDKGLLKPIKMEFDAINTDVKNKVNTFFANKLAQLIHNAINCL